MTPLLEKESSGPSTRDRFRNLVRGQRRNFGERSI
jgi:hypothetical protein